MLTEVTYNPSTTSATFTYSDGKRRTHPLSVLFYEWGVTEKIAAKAGRMADQMHASGEGRLHQYEYERSKAA